MFRGKHRRAQSDVSAAWQMFIPNNLKSPDPRSSSAAPGLTSPLPGNSKRISEPQLADADMQQRIAVEKKKHLRKMLQQTQYEYESLKAEYQKSPTESNHSRMEATAQVMQRLKSQIMNPRSPSVADPINDILTDYPGIDTNWEEAYDGRRRSLDMDVLSQKVAVSSSSSVGLPPHPPQPPPPPSVAHTNITGPSAASSSRRVSGHRKMDSASAVMVAHALGNYGVDGLASKKEVYLSRSHSDSYRRNRRLPNDDGLRQAASNDELQHLRQPPAAEPGSSSLASSASSESVKQRFSCERSRSKSQEVGSISDENVGENAGGAAESPLSPVTENSANDSIFSDASYGDTSLLIGSGRLRQANIMGMEEDEFSSEEENEVDQGFFSDFSQIRNRPAHLAVLLHYLLSNSSPNPLLFYMITEYYQNSTKDVKETRKWAYEIYSSFLVEKACLKVTMPDEVVAAIENVLLYKHDKEESLKFLFMQSRNFALTAITELLGDFRNKRSLGLGNIYGDHELKDVMDGAAVMRTFDTALWRHFEINAMEEDKECSQVMASALATFLKQYGYTNSKNNALLDKFPVFVTKDKKTAFFTSKPKPKTILHRGHSFQQQQCMVPTYCQVCQEILSGVGYQGYQCTKCEHNVHKRCVELGKDTCSGKKDNRRRPPSGIFQRPPIAKLPLRPQEHAKDHEEVVKKPNDETGSNHDVRISSPEDAPSIHHSASEVNDGLGSPRQGNFARFSDTVVPSSELCGAGDQGLSFVPSQRRHYNDSDLETEPEMPSTDTIIAKEVLRKLKPKKKKVPTATLR